MGTGLVPAFRLKLQMSTTQLGQLGKGIVNVWVVVCLFVLLFVKWDGGQST